ncbi:MAG: putative ABC transport system permease protein [Planctomycetota bacterium]|jgi:putative ABC transport system permease protein
MDILRLSLQHLAFHRLRSALLVGSLAVAMAVPIAASLLLGQYDAALRARAQATPQILGPRGNRFDLVLATLYWRTGPLEPLTWSAYEDVASEPGVVAAPMHVGFRARGKPVVGTTPEYFEHRGLRIASGSTPLMLGEATLGAAAAAELGLGPGDQLFSDPSELYNLLRPSSLQLTIAGVFAPTSGPDDAAVFVDVKTAWVLEGLYHGHQEAEAALADNPDLLLGKGDQRLSLSGALLEHNQVDPATLEDFHLHGDPGTRPLSAVLLWPETAKAATLLKARVNAQDKWRVIVPAAVVDELLEVVLQAKRLFDSATAFLLAATALLVGLVLTLSTRMRQSELRTLDRIGCAAGTLPALIASEVLVILALAAVGAALLMGAAQLLAPRLVNLL